MKTDELIELVKKWSTDKGLDKADPRAQFLKVAEEVGEVASALARDNQDKLIDGIGDTVVTLIILCQQLGLELENCLMTAYMEIREREGKMVNGVFVKFEDLEG